MARILLTEPVRSIDDYFATDVGGRAIERAVELGPAATIAEVTASGLRGRGGGGFPTGRKWRGVVNESGTDRYVVCNAAEGEPGTFKDRTLMRTNPYQFVEGAIVAAYAIGAVEVFICLKAAFTDEIAAVTKAVREMQEAGICRECRVTIVEGPDEYLYGEEKAMLEVIEGNPPLPRLLPPYQHGLFATAPQTGWTSTDVQPGHEGRHESNPTLVNNVETLSAVTHIMTKGSLWYRSFGTHASPGTVVCTVSGDMERAAVGEFELGTPLHDVLEQLGGGPHAGHDIKAVFSGVANAVVTADHLDAPVSYEGFEAIGSGLGSCGFVAYDEQACMVEVARQFSRFLYIESCGQCPPCKRGSGEVTSRLERLEGGSATDSDLAEIGYWLQRVTDGNRCFLAVEEQTMVASILRAFPGEFAEHLEQGRCPRPSPIRLPKIVDIIDGDAIYDERHYLKRPDWTYGDEPSPAGAPLQ